MINIRAYRMDAELINKNNLWPSDLRENEEIIKIAVEQEGQDWVAPQKWLYAKWHYN